MAKRKKRKSTRRPLPKKKKPVIRKRRSTILVHPWPLHWPIPPGSAPGTVAVYYQERVIHVRIGKRRYRRLRGFSQWFLLPVKPLARWVTCPEFQAGIENEKTFAGHEVTLLEMKVYHSNDTKDFVNTESRFVWRVPRHPVNIKGRGVLPPFRLGRIWFWVKRVTDRAPEGKQAYEYQIWCRTAFLPHPVVFSDLHREAQALYKHVVKEVPHLTGPSAEGFKVAGFIAWTGYIGHPPKTRRKKWHK